MSDLDSILLLTRDISSSSLDHDENGTTVFLDKHISVRIVVGITCVLSMAGSLLIILSYACFKNLQSQGRLILFNLALMDFGVGLFNLVGAAVNFDQYYYNTSVDHPITPAKAVADSCLVQAIFAHFCTGSSVLWTSCLAVYMYFLIFQNWERKVRWFLPLSCVFCYGIPLGLSTWLIFTNRLGHSPYNAAAWCGLINTKSSGDVDYIATTIGYDLWIYLAIFLSITIYSALFLYLHIEYQGARSLIGKKQYWKQAIQFLDIKLVFIPLVFIILRAWTCVLNILFTYIEIRPQNIPTPVSLALIYLSGIGDSGQGFANGLLFVIFTTDVRRKMFGCNICGSKQENSETEPILSLEESEKMDTPPASLPD